MITLASYSDESSNDTPNAQYIDSARQWAHLKKRSDVGFPKIPELEEMWHSVEKRAQEILAQRPRVVLVLGIGGSSLGTQVIKQAFPAQAPNVELFFLESPDPSTWQRLMRIANWQEACHVLVISKSGNTLETLSWLEKINSVAPHLISAKNLTVIASPGTGPLQTLARQKELPILWIPSEVGGRFSVLTPVSLLPAALLGLDLSEFRQGAIWALSQIELMNGICSRVVASWKHDKAITQMWVYSESLKVFGDWWQQLWGESLGKAKTRDGSKAPKVSTPQACLGPRDQHSLVQQLIEGAPDKFVIIVRVQEVENNDLSFLPTLFERMPFYNENVSLGEILAAEAEAFEKSLKAAQIPYLTLVMDKTSERHLGALFMLWQMVVGTLGEHLGINAFDQPGVELGKLYANELLSKV